MHEWSPSARLALAVLVLAACSPAEDAEDPRRLIPAIGAWNSGVELTAEAQAGGDPVRGRELLLDGDYMTCGLPAKLWDNPLTRPFIAIGFGNDYDAPKLDGRNAANADLPYFLTKFRAPGTTVDVVTANCLMCHGGSFDGDLVMGLGNAGADFTSAGAATEVSWDESLYDSLGLDAAEKAMMDKMTERAMAIAAFASMRTVGHNPAEMYAVILMAHHDRETLAWSQELVTPIVVYDRDGQPIPVSDAVVTSDVPPWWRAHKKNALFYNGMARGDHRGTMALASSVCVDSVERATEVDAQFADIQAYVSSLRAPSYTRAIDREQAALGERVYLRECAGCHGTYDEDETREWYPNLLIPLDVIKTDPVVAEAGTLHAPALVEWYNASFYGQITRMEPDDPFPGYMPPPLDGIWATAPFLHNGSVPTLELVLDSKARPTYWKRVDYDTRNFDEEAGGWPWVAVDYPQAEAPADERKHIYDTTYWSQSNAGHEFGDHLTPANGGR